MKFTALRSLTLAAMGHVLVFAKGDTKFVPPVLREKALEMGLEPEDGAEVERAEKPDDATRIAAVKAAMEAIAKRNKIDDFDAGGVPKVKAIQAETEGAKPLNNDERLALWAQVVSAAST